MWRRYDGVCKQPASPDPFDSGASPILKGAGGFGNPDEASTAAKRGAQRVAGPKPGGACWLFTPSGSSRTTVTSGLHTLFNACD
jgi:hypothetical protein